jgi:hypothetical protein
MDSSERRNGKAANTAPSGAEELMRLQARVELLEAAVIELSEDPPSKRFRAWLWQDLDTEQYASRLERLALWVDESLVARERTPSALAPDVGESLGGGKADEVLKLRQCWREHPDVLDTLTALYVAWYGAYRDPHPSSVAALDYQSRWRPEAVRRLNRAMDGCEWRCTMVSDPQPSSNDPQAAANDGT